MKENKKDNPGNIHFLLFSPQCLFPDQRQISIWIKMSSANFSGSSKILLCSRELMTRDKQPLVNIVGNGEVLIIFLYFPRFLPFRNTPSRLNYIFFVVCKCFQFTKVQKLCRLKIEVYITSSNSINRWRNIMTLTCFVINGILDNYVWPINLHF